MIESQELTFTRRTNAVGKPSIAPYIGGWCVWAIPTEEWTTAVQEAIKHAYELGWRHCNGKHAEVESHVFPLDAYFKGPSDEQ